LSTTDAKAPAAKKPAPTEDKAYPPGWHKAAVKELRGDPFDKLIWKTPEDIDVKPLYTQSDINGVPLAQGKWSQAETNRAHLLKIFPLY